MVVQLPGFYYDETKRKYFKIGTGPASGPSGDHRPPDSPEKKRRTSVNSGLQSHINRAVVHRCKWTAADSVLYSVIPSAEPCAAYTAAALTSRVSLTGNPSIYTSRARLHALLGQIRCIRRVDVIVAPETLSLARRAATTDNFPRLRPVNGTEEADFGSNQCHTVTGLSVDTIGICCLVVGLESGVNGFVPVYELIYGSSNSVLLGNNPIVPAFSSVEVIQRLPTRSGVFLQTRGSPWQHALLCVCKTPSGDLWSRADLREELSFAESAGGFVGVCRAVAGRKCGTAVRAVFQPEHRPEILSSVVTKSGLIVCGTEQGAEGFVVDFGADTGRQWSRLWSCATTSAVTALAAAESGDLIAAGCRGGTVHVICGTGDCVIKISGNSLVRAVFWLNSGSSETGNSAFLLIVALDFGIRLFRVATNDGDNVAEFLHTLPKPQTESGTARCAAVDEAGELLAVASGTGRVYLYDIFGGYIVETPLSRAEFDSSMGSITFTNTADFALHGRWAQLGGGSAGPSGSSYTERLLAYEDRLTARAESIRHTNGLLIGYGKYIEFWSWEIVG